MINPTCDICSIDLSEFGAIILSPPDKSGMVRKFHICIVCYDNIIEPVISSNRRGSSDA
ncbi:MAG: hypothetical protein KAS32_28130 [Candidatus Peribacteraceae bacterium]|nr:hypothetical protein [Candidatus Peribacteraceae bacterium]